MARRVIEFDATSLLHLMTHYTQDNTEPVPLDAELLSAGVSQFLPRWIMLLASSENEWRDVPVAPNGELQPLHVRYEGHKTMTWGGDNQAPCAWQESVESPKS